MKNDTHAKLAEAWKKFDQRLEKIAQELAKQAQEDKNIPNTK